MPLDLRPTLVEGKVYRGKKKQEGDDEKQAMKELAIILDVKKRQQCNCEAQVHELLENCLECGRFTCTAEGSGPCLFCGATVLSQDQRERLMKHLDFLRPVTMGLPAISSGPRTRIIDNQYDYSAIDNKKHLKEDERSRMKANLEELRAKRYQRKLMLDIDIDNLEAGSRSMPQVDDYEAELARLQLDCQPIGTNSTLTLTQLVVDESKRNYQFEYVAPNEIKKSQRRDSKSDGVVVNVGSSLQKQKHSQLKNKTSQKKSSAQKQNLPQQPTGPWNNRNNNNDNKDRRK